MTDPTRRNVLRGAAAITTAGALVGTGAGSLPAAAAPRTARRFPFLERFRGIVVSGELGVMKPDARIFHHLTETHALDAKDCLFIDDSLKNVAGARAAGLQALHFTAPDALRASLRQYGLL